MSSNIEDIEIDNEFQKMLENLKKSSYQMLSLNSNNLGAWDERRITAFFAGLAQSQVQTLSV